MNSTNKDLLYYTAVRWLSKGNVIARVFELMDELKIYFKSQGKSTEHPFIIIMDYTFPIPEEMENEFLSLVNNTSMKNVFKQEENISDFWTTISSQYPK